MTKYIFQKNGSPNIFIYKIKYSAGYRKRVLVIVLKNELSGSAVCAKTE